MGSSSLTSNAWVGQQVGERNRYRLDQILGSGGMGEVYLAMDLLLGKPVALKLLHKSLRDNLELRQRFEREIVISAALISEHIVQVTDHGIIEGEFPYYVMEYLSGQNLATLMKTEPCLPPERAVRILLQVCAGLRVAHNGITLWREGATSAEHIKVIHRDLKPDNLFLVPHDILGELVKILDFGIAKIRGEHLSLADITDSGNFLGTCRYAAPEQWQGEDRVDERTDIYSLGMLLYQMLSGTDPFGLHSGSRNVPLAAWLSAHAYTKPIRLRQLKSNQWIPPLLDDVLMRCLEKDPDHRFASVSELSQALQAAIGEPLPLYNRQSETEPAEPKRNLAGSPNPRSSPPIEFPLKQAVPNALTHPLLKKPLASMQPEEVKLTQHFWIPKLFNQTGIITLITVITASLGTFIWFRTYSTPLNQALTAAQTGDFSTAIALAKTVQRGDLNYTKAQVLLSEWQLLLARQAAEKGDLNAAIALARHLHPQDSTYQAAQILLADWQLAEAENRLRRQEYDVSATLLQQISSELPQFAKAQKLQLMIESWQQAQTLSQSGQLQQSIAAAYSIAPDTALSGAAETLICQNLAGLLSREFRIQVNQASNGDPPLFKNYQLSGCLSPSLTIRSEVARLTARDEDNLKIIALVMAGFVWQKLPPAAHARFQEGEIQIQLIERSSPMANIFINKPSLLSAGKDKLEEMITSMQVHYTKP
jgi:serine/threonine-protein kinase